jgi:lactate dehydrogenase-like 2-hydroxyacid dehydrogenase
LADFEIVMPYPMHALVIANLESWAILYKLWEAPDRQGMIASISDRIKAMASSYGAGKIDASLIGQFPKLEIISHFGVGYDIVDVDYAAAHGIVVTNTPDVLNEEVADVAIGLLLATIRQFPQADRFVRGGHWLKGAFPLTASLRGRTMGIFGLGRIGKAIARRAEAFGVKVCYTGRNPQKDVTYPYFETLKELAGACDILMVVAPATAETKHAVNADVLSALGPEGVLINIARGSLVDEQALIAALREKRILSAGLDVFENEPNVPQALIEMDHIVLLPHVGSASHVTRQAMGQLVCDNLKSYAEGKGPVTPVPETPFPPKNSSLRIA